MSEAPRDKKERWLRDLERVRGCETRTLIAEEMSRDDGLSWLTDEQIDALAERAVSKLRHRNHITIRNRRFYAAQQRSESAA